MSNFYYTKMVFKLDFSGEYVRVYAESVPYEGPWDLCKGDDTAKAEEASTAAFDQQLMTIFNAQYATQKSQLDYLTAKMKPMIENPVGYDPTTLASMRTGAEDTTSTEYQNAQGALQNKLSQESGGSKLIGVSGAATQDTAALLASEATDKATAQENITAQDAALKNQNYWNSINVLSGNAATENPLGYASASSNAGQTVTGLSGAVTAANQSQLLGALGGIAGGVGSAIGGKLAGCWIAAALYDGWDSAKTWAIRLWMATSAPKWFSRFYYRYGERISRTPARWRRAKMQPPE